MTLSIVVDVQTLPGELAVSVPLPLAFDWTSFVLLTLIHK
jgi:hypothetical protein